MNMNILRVVSVMLIVFGCCVVKLDAEQQSAAQASVDAARQAQQESVGQYMSNISQSSRSQSKQGSLSGLSAYYGLTRSSEPQRTSTSTPHPAFVGLQDNIARSVGSIGVARPVLEASQPRGQFVVHERENEQEDAE